MCKRFLWLASFTVAGLALFGVAVSVTQAADEKSLTIDDFENYTDEEPYRIFDTWLDGWKNDTNGSVVGNAEAPFAEQTIVHAGAQSMKPIRNSAVPECCTLTTSSCSVACP
jgi:hypothetical protein